MLPWLTYCILIFFCSTPWGVIYVLYIITNVFGKILIKIIPHYFCGYCSNVQHFTTLKNILSMSFCTFHTYRIPQFAMSVSTFLRDLCPYIINRLLGKEADIAPFLMLMHTYSLIAISMQIRASIFDENSV